MAQNVGQGEARPSSPGGGGLISRDLLSSTCRDIRRIVFAMVITLVIGAALAASLPPRYVADATLLMPGAQSGAAMADRAAFERSQAEILSSRPMQAAAMRIVGAAQLYPNVFAPPAWQLVWNRLTGTGTGTGDARAAAARRFRDGFAVTVDTDSNVIKLRFAHRDPTLAAASVNALVAVYLSSLVDVVPTAPQVAPNTTANNLREQLDQAEQALAEFQANNGGAGFGKQRDLLAARRDGLLADIHRARAEIAEGQLFSLVPSPAPATMPAVQPAPQDPEAARHAAELALVGAPNAVPVAERAPEHAAAAPARRRAPVNLTSVRARLADDEQQLTVALAALTDTDTNEAELRQLTQAHERLRHEVEAAAKAPQSAPASAPKPTENSGVRVIQFAEAPDRPTDLPELVFGVSVLVSLFIGVTVALLSHLFRRGYISPETLERRLGVPVLASIPDLGRLDRSFDRLSDYGPAEG